MDRSVHHRRRQRKLGRADLADEIGSAPEPMHGITRREIKRLVGANQLPVMNDCPLAQMDAFQVGSHGLVGGNLVFQIGHLKAPMPRPDGNDFGTLLVQFQIRFRIQGLIARLASARSDTLDAL
jgi:hypothetical protein